MRGNLHANSLAHVFPLASFPLFSLSCVLGGKSDKPGKALLLVKIGLVETKAKSAIHLRVINEGLQYTPA